MRDRVALALATIGVALFAVTVAAHAQEKRYALLIGNQAYDASVGALKNPHNDIALVAGSLAKQGFEILPLIKDARRSAILGAVRELAAKLRTAGSGSVGFLYYSGHGAAEKDTGINYLIPVDAKDPGSAAFWDDSLKLEDITRLLDQARGAVKFVVFDACRNELQLPTRDTTKGLVPVADQQGFFVAYASAPGRTASDRGERSGPYAAALASELTRQGLDHLNLFQNVKEAVIASTGGSQNPWESNGLTRRVYLTGEPTTPADMALWETVSKSSDVPALQGYLGRFPNGVFAATARLMIERLNAEAALRQQSEAERKALDQKQAAVVRGALEEARKARDALASAERQRAAAVAREDELRKAQAALQSVPAKSGEQADTDRAAATVLAQRAQMAAEDARTAREALAAAEGKRKEAETRLAALERAEQDRKAALEILRQQDAAAAKREDVSLQAVQKAQTEFQQRREIQLGQYFSLNDQCRWQSPPAIETIKKPQYGKIVVREGQITAVAIFAKQRQHCLGSKGTGRSVYYVLDEKHRDRSDVDSLALRLRYSGGSIIDVLEYDVDLGQRTSTRTKFSRQQ